MKIYRIYKYYDGREDPEIIYISNYSKAVQTFNNLIRKEYKEIDVISKDEFSIILEKFRIWALKYADEVVCRKYPLIIHKLKLKGRNKGYRIVANIPHKIKSEFNSKDYEIEFNNLVLEEIEVI